jgi:hypothetical protein
MEPSQEQRRAIGTTRVHKLTQVVGDDNRALGIDGIRLSDRYTSAGQGPALLVNHKSERCRQWL